jgi:uncharacterized protein with FMN-binding domain
MVKPHAGGSTARIVAAAGATFAAVALLFGYPTSTGQSTTGTATIVATGTTNPTTTDPGTTDTGTTDSGTGSGSGSTGSTTTASTTVAGSVAQTQWGPVQVQITVQGGKVVAATVLQVPSGNHRDQEINAYAVPILNSEAVAASSAQIDSVSGATVTSYGYRESLQAALDAAHLS